MWSFPWSTLDRTVRRLKWETFPLRRLGALRRAQSVVHGGDIRSPVRWRPGSRDTGPSPSPRSDKGRLFLVLGVGTYSPALISESRSTSRACDFQGLGKNLLVLERRRMFSVFPRAAPRDRQWPFNNKHAAAFDWLKLDRNVQIS